MIKLEKSIKQRAYPIWEIKEIRYAKLKLRHGKRGYDVRIQLEYGLSDWLRAAHTFIWTGAGEKKIKLKRTTEENVKTIKKYLKRKKIVKIRIPELEKRPEVKKKVRKEQKKLRKQRKRWN